jgi:PTS system mannose-specific IIA component
VRTKKKTNPWVGVVVMTHGNAALELLSAARSIVGELRATIAVGLPVGAEMQQILTRLAQSCDEVDEGAGVLMLVDIHGSTPFNAAMALLDGTRPAEVLCGVNLPMLIKLATVDRRSKLPESLAEELRESGRRSIRLGSELTGKVLAGSRG